MLQFLIEYILKYLPKVMVTPKLFMIVCVSIASCKRSFSKLKLIKNYFRATMIQSKLSNLGILAIEHEAIRNINLGDVTFKFVADPARTKCNSSVRANN